MEAKKKRVVKKKRSKAQIAATKKLVAMNKAKGKKKSVPKKRATSKKKVVPKKRALYVLTLTPKPAAIKNGASPLKGYFTGVRWDTDIGYGLRFAKKFEISKLQLNKELIPNKRYYGISYTTVTK